MHTLCKTLEKYGYRAYTSECYASRNAYDVLLLFDEFTVKFWATEKHNDWKNTKEPKGKTFGKHGYDHWTRWQREKHFC